MKLERVPKQEKMPFDGLTVYGRRFAVTDDCLWFRCRAEKVALTWPD
jgi:hypothetical protein